MTGFFRERATDFPAASKRWLSESPKIRSAGLWCLSRGCHPERFDNRIVCIMYHGVRPDARKSFAHQLRYLRCLGDFISTSQAIDLLERGNKIDGRYFCITFDDGEYSAFRNGFTLLSENGIPSTFFLVPAWIAPESPMERSDRKYLSWDNCRQIVRNGGTIGSHTFSHHRLSTLAAQEVTNELVTSRLMLERELNLACDQFACPWGQPGRDYIVERDPGLAAAAGYRSFFTTIRGSALRGTSPWAIPRIRLEPEWELHQLRYLLCR
jgi:peptidoglycan/xylan/chitin deacetylase (PgdA/CDA1 family)